MDFIAGAYAVGILALVADDVLVTAAERRGHRAGRNDEGLRLERAEKESQDEGNDNRFDGLADAVLVSAGRRTAVGIPSWGLDSRRTLGRRGGFFQCFAP